MEGLPHLELQYYRIVSKIGEGGMGEVYLAQDTKLDRKVALKILPADVAADTPAWRRLVLAESATHSKRGKHMNVGKIGHALNVKSVLEGSIRKSATLTPK